MFEYSIVFNNKLPEVLLNSVRISLSQAGFVYGLIKIDNDNVLLIKMQEVINLLFFFKGSNNLQYVRIALVLTSKNTPIHDLEK